MGENPENTENYKGLPRCTKMFIDHLEIFCLSFTKPE